MHFLLLTLFLVGVRSDTFENVTLKWTSDNTSNISVSSFNNLEEVLPNNTEKLSVTLNGLVPVLPEDSVSGVENLKSLVMAAVGLEEITPGALKNLPNLETLVLNRNNLSKIKNATFAGLKLLSLFLDNNVISELHSGAFKGLQVRHLTLSNNKLSKIEAGVFDDSLVSLNLYGNSLQKIEPGAFGAKLANLVLSNNKLEEIDSEAFNLPELSSLDVSFNNIKMLRPGDFKNLPQLSNLEMVANNLEKIPTGVFNFLKISHLKLNYNKITDIDSYAFDNMPNLSVLHIDHNNLTTWDINWLKNASQLAYIFAGFNQIEKIPDQAFQNYPRMYSINLEGNGIVTVASEAFDKLENVVNFSLRDNEIQEWDPNLLSNVSIGTVDLSGNKLKCIQGNLDVVFTNVDFVNLGGNPWGVGCKEKVGEFLKNKEKAPKMRSYFSK